MKEITLDSLEKIKKIGERLKILDSEILNINKTAQLIAEKKSEIRLLINTVDIDATKKEKSKAQFDEDGSLRQSENNHNPLRFYPSFSMTYSTPSEQPTVEVSLKIEESIDEKTCFCILGFILNAKKEERQKLLAVLASYGVRI
jgi:hypothetical protein